jgi:hypothetical protein
MLSSIEDDLFEIGDKVIKEYDDKIIDIQEQAQIKMVKIKIDIIIFILYNIYYIFLFVIYSG